MSLAISPISSRYSRRFGISWRPRPRSSISRWSGRSPRRSPDDLFIVEANGASPADQSVTVVAWLVHAGESVRAGQRIAEVESDKSVLDISSPLDGTVKSILVPEGESVECRHAPGLDRRSSPGRGA